MNKAKTNNSYLYDKVALRVAFLPEVQTVRVLDCYHGAGMIWRNVQRNTDKRLAIHGIDMSDYGTGEAVLLGDNLKVFDSLDLASYDVIDLDAYGVPAEQMIAVWPRMRSGAVIFYTFTQTMLGQLPRSMFDRLGYTASMIARCPTLFAKNGHEKFLHFISLQTLSTIVYCKHGRKFYGTVRKE
jgi:hypothetical protein